VTAVLNTLVPIVEQCKTRLDRALSAVYPEDVLVPGFSGDIALAAAQSWAASAQSGSSTDGDSSMGSVLAANFAVLTDRLPLDFMCSTGSTLPLVHNDAITLPALITRLHSLAQQYRQQPTSGPATSAAGALSTTPAVAALIKRIKLAIQHLYKATNPKERLKLAQEQRKLMPWLPDVTAVRAV